jgi:hypothetical protein
LDHFVGDGTHMITTRVVHASEGMVDFHGPEEA